MWSTGSVAVGSSSSVVGDVVPGSVARPASTGGVSVPGPASSRGSCFGGVEAGVLSWLRDGEARQGQCVRPGTLTTTTNTTRHKQRTTRPVEPRR